MHFNISCSFVFDPLRLLSLSVPGDPKVLVDNMTNNTGMLIKFQNFHSNQIIGIKVVVEVPLKILINQLTQKIPKKRLPLKCHYKRCIWECKYLLWLCDFCILIFWTHFLYIRGLYFMAKRHFRMQKILGTSVCTDISQNALKTDMFNFYVKKSLNTFFYYSFFFRFLDQLRLQKTFS